MNTYRFSTVPTGGALAETVTEAGTEVQIVGTTEFVLMGFRRPGQTRWMMTTVTEPTRFGEKWDTVKALKPWVAKYEEAAA